MTVQQPHRRDSFGILLVPQFPIYVLTMVVESLRLANKCLNTSTYDWRIITRDGQPVTASNGMCVTPEASIRQVAHLGTLVVISGYQPERAYDTDLLGWIRQAARLGTRVGGIDTGAFILAKAGLLEACPVTVHWQSMTTFEESFPFLQTTEALFTISETRFTCAGGAATLDLMLNLIALEQGNTLAQKVAQDFVHDHIRAASEDQRSAEDHQWKHSNPALAKILQVMEQNIEEPLPMNKLTALSGSSRRQLERIFSRDLGTTPMRHYLLMRLNKARQLILLSQISIRSTALACGFASLPVFSRSYRTQFGNSPSEHRRLFRAQGLGGNLSQQIQPLIIDAGQSNPGQLLN